jgi:RecA-family ATPase
MNKIYFSSKDARTLINNFGFSLFPIHGVVDGQCTCGNTLCDNQGKHPATSNGFLDASKNIEEVLRLWNARKFLNVGVATGAASDVFVIDIDGEVGEENIKALNLPSTLQVNTGKGRHLYFKYPGKKIITRRGILEKVDVRGDGGYVAGVGSNHLSGRKYEWHNPLQPIADAPESILDLVLEERIKKKPANLNISNPGKSLIFRDRQSVQDVEEMLNFIDPDCGYDEWIGVGMAVQSDGYPFSVWDNWSRGGSKYEAANMGAHWKSFHSGGGITMGTVFHRAKEGGWSPKKTSTNIIHPISYNAEREETGREIIDADGQVFTLDPDMFYIKAIDIHESLDTSDFVQGLLSDGALSVVYGESNCGKTFFMGDLAMHVAMGRRWCDKRVEAGGVIYVALEGSYGLKNRVAAFKKHYSLIPDKFAMVPCPVDFMDPEGNINKFIEMLRIAKTDMGSVRLVIVDTLARALTGGDENSGQDMGMLVHHADRIRYETGAHVCFIHHSGKDKARGARGHSSLRAAVDTEIEISRDTDADFSKVKVVKQREMEMDKEFYFSLKRVDLGINKHNEEVTSCVVMPYEASDMQKTKSKLKPLVQKSLDALADYIMSNGKTDNSSDMPHNLKMVTQEEFKNMLIDRGILSDESDTNRSQFARIKRELFENNRAVFKKAKVWLI